MRDGSAHGSCAWRGCIWPICPFDLSDFLHLRLRARRIDFVGVFLCIKKNVSSLKPWFRAWTFCLLATLTFGGSGLIQSSWQIRQARQFVANASATLDKIKTQTGRYSKNLPDDVEQIRPAIVHFSSHGDSYNFFYPTGIIQGYIYDSKTRAWKYRD